MKDGSILLEYIEMSARRPGMHFGSNDVRDVFRHLTGWRAHRRYVSDADEFAEYFFEEFHGFVENYYQDRRTIGWARLITEYEEPDDRFPKYMELVAAFANERGFQLS